MGHPTNFEKGERILDLKVWKVGLGYYRVQPKIRMMDRGIEREV